MDLNLPKNYLVPLRLEHIELLNQSTFNFKRITVEHFAQQLSFIDRQFLLNIEWNEINSGSWMSKEKYIHAKNIMLSIDFFNHISNFIAYQIVKLHKIIKRRKMLIFFINVI